MLEWGKRKLVTFSVKCKFAVYSSPLNNVNLDKWCLETDLNLVLSYPNFLIILMMQLYWNDCAKCLFLVKYHSIITAQNSTGSIKNLKHPTDHGMKKEFLITYCGVCVGSLANDRHVPVSVGPPHKIQCPSLPQTTLIKIPNDRAELSPRLFNGLDHHVNWTFEFPWL